MVRVERIELSLQPWEGHVLPLNYTRMFLLRKSIYHRSLVIDH